MKNALKQIQKTAAVICGTALLLAGCSDFNQDWEVLEFEAPVLAAASTLPADGILDQGDEVTFTDNTDPGMILSRTWSFPGGTPAESTEAIPTVTFNAGGVFTASLEIQFRDNTKQTMEFPYEVIGQNAAPVSGYGLFSENSGLGTVTPPDFQPNNAAIMSIVVDAYEGVEAIKLEFTKEDTWGFMASLKPTGGGTVDISEYADGYYNIALKTTCTKKMLLRLQGGGTNAIITLDPSQEPYGFKRDGNWYALKIPMKDFTDNAAVDLAAISDLMVFRSGESAVAASEDWDWYVDHIYLSKE